MALGSRLGRKSARKLGRKSALPGHGARSVTVHLVTVKVLSRSRSRSGHGGPPLCCGRLGSTWLGSPILLTLIDSVGKSLSVGPLGQPGAATLNESTVWSASTIQVASGYISYISPTLGHCLGMAWAEGRSHGYGGRQLKIRHPSQLAVDVRDSDEWV